MQPSSDPDGRPTIRRFPLSQRLLTWFVLLAGAAVATALASVAYAFWTSSGSGFGAAATGTMDPPTAVVATASAESATVPVSWSPTVGPTGGPVDGYYVERYSGQTPAAACSSSPAALLSAPTTTCDDVGVPNGTYTYVVTAVVGSWTARSQASAPTSVDAISFEITAPGSTTAGNPFTVSVTARDGSGAQVTDYAGTVRFTSSDPGSPVLPPDYTFSPVDNGTMTFTNAVELRTAPSQSITVTEVGRPARDGTTNVTVNAGAATKAAFSVQPGGGLGGAVWATQPKVEIQDAHGNRVSTGGSVTLSIASGTAGATLTCTNNPRTVVAGVATFAGCKIDKVGTYVLTATSGALTTGASASFAVTVGPAITLGYLVQPSVTVAGSVISPAVRVAAQDAGGNTVDTVEGTVDLAFAANPGSATLNGTLSVPFVNGVAVFNDLSIEKAGNGYSLMATFPGLTSATSSTFNVTASTPSRVRFTTDPGGGTGGVAWAVQPRVTIQDSFGNTVSSSSTVTLTIVSGTSGAVLTCTANPKAAASGLATFAGCKIDKAGSYTLRASSGVLETDTSVTFDVEVGAATKLGYRTQPTAVVAGAVISPAVTVAVQDAGGNTVTTSSATISLGFGANPGAGTLSGTTVRAVVDGEATFDDLSINKSGTGYTLVATSAGLASATSSTFNVTVGAATRVGFTVQPGGGTGGVSWGTQPRVAIQDDNGNTVSSSASVTLTIASGPTAALTCTSNPRAASSGVATFAACKIDKAGSYTLTATSGALATDTSVSFTVAVGAATKLGYLAQPTAVVAGQVISPAVTVAVQDAGGNTVTTSSATISLGFGANPGAGTLSGTTVRAVVDGEATFDDLSINKSGTGYTLSATSGGLTTATSSTFNVTAAAATQVRFTVQPGGGTGGVAWATQPRVTIQDAFGNTVSSTASVTLSIASGTSGAVLTCTTNPLTAVAGVATFVGCKIDKSGSYTLTASSTGLTADTSASLTVAVGAANKLGYRVQPSAVVAGVAISPAVEVSVQDAGGNTVTTSSATVVLAISTNPGGGTLSGTLSRAASAGVATFTNLSINKSGNSYTLNATSSGLTASISAAFNVTAGAATKVGFTTQPTAVVAGASISPAVVVAVQDANGNTVTTSSATVTMAFGANPGAGTLSGTVAVAASGGLATFSDLSINKSANNYSLAASSTGLAGATSSTFNVAAGAPSQLAFTTQTTGGTGGTTWGTQPRVTIRDAFGNTTTSTASVNLSIASGTSGAVLTCTVNPRSATAGLATFAGCKIDKTGSYTLSATLSGVTSATSNSFNVTVGAAAKLSFSTEPGGGAAGVAWATQPQVIIQDAGGNTTTSTASVTLAITAGTGTSGAVLTCTTNPRSATSGTATFAGCRINLAGTGYTLRATSGALTLATSLPFDIT